MTKVLQLRVTGMHCSSCANRVASVLCQEFKDDIISVTVDPVSGLARLLLKTSSGCEAKAVTSVEGLGYSAVLLSSHESQPRSFRLRTRDPLRAEKVIASVDSVVSVTLGEDFVVVKSSEGDEVLSSVFD